MGCGEIEIAPQTPPHERQDIAEGGCGFLIPGCLPVRRAPSGRQGSAKERHEAVEPEEERSRALNGAIGSLPLGLDP
jgi:hypothetical protein